MLQTVISVGCAILCTRWVDVVPPDRSLSPSEEADLKTGWVHAEVYGRGSEDAVGVRGSDAWPGPGGQGKLPEEGQPSWQLKDEVGFSWNMEELSRKRPLPLWLEGPKDTGEVGEQRDRWAGWRTEAFWEPNLESPVVRAWAWTKQWEEKKMERQIREDHETLLRGVRDGPCVSSQRPSSVIQGISNEVSPSMFLFSRKTSF